jgi:hypothetical protein
VTKPKNPKPVAPPPDPPIAGTAMEVALRAALSKSGEVCNERFKEDARAGGDLTPEDFFRYMLAVGKPKRDVGE